MINEGISDGATPVYGAAWKNSIKTLNLLLSAKADVNVTKDGGTSPLFVAVQQGHDEVLEILLSAGADPNRVRTDGVGPVFMATLEHNPVKKTNKLTFKGYSNNKKGLYSKHP